MAFWHQRNASEAGIFIKECYFFDGSEAAVEEITPSFLCNLVNKSEPWLAMLPHGGGEKGEEEAFSHTASLPPCGKMPCRFRQFD